MLLRMSNVRISLYFTCPYTSLCTFIYQSFCQFPVICYIGGFHCTHSRLYCSLSNTVSTESRRISWDVGMHVMVFQVNHICIWYVHRNLNIVSWNFHYIRFSGKISSNDPLGWSLYYNESETYSFTLISVHSWKSTLFFSFFYFCACHHHSCR